MMIRILCLGASMVTFLFTVTAAVERESLDSLGDLSRKPYDRESSHKHSSRITPSVDTHREHESLVDLDSLANRVAHVTRNNIDSSDDSGEEWDGGPGTIPGKPQVTNEKSTTNVSQPLRDSAPDADGEANNKKAIKKSEDEGKRQQVERHATEIERDAGPVERREGHEDPSDKRQDHTEKDNSLIDYTSTINTTLPRCQLPYETGPCRASYPMWYYNATSGSCDTFLFGGCAGNDNRFWSELQCLAACPDERACPTNQIRICRVSEACRNASCPNNDEAECTVSPCTCEVSFVDHEGEEVNCSTGVEMDTRPEWRLGDLDISSGDNDRDKDVDKDGVEDGDVGSGESEMDMGGRGGNGHALGDEKVDEGGLKFTDKGVDEGRNDAVKLNQSNKLDEKSAKNATTEDGTADIYQEAGLWTGVSLGLLLLLTGIIVAFLKWRGSRRSYAIFLLKSNEDTDLCENTSKFTEYSSIMA